MAFSLTISTDRVIRNSMKLYQHFCPNMKPGRSVRLLDGHPQQARSARLVGRDEQ